nr:MAG TPA: hypothetical protein [Bacteriophage sp.]
MPQNFHTIHPYQHTTQGFDILNHYFSFYPFFQLVLFEP